MQFNTKKKLTKLITIIIPIYNVEHYLQSCIESVVNQSYENLDIILVDDGSSDGSGSLCDYYARTDMRVTCIHQANCGLSGARNAGIPLMKGEYVFFVDADDELCPDAIQTLVNYLMEEEWDLVVFGFNKIRIEYSQGKENKTLEIVEKDDIGDCDIISFSKRLEKVEYGKLVGYEPVWDKLYNTDIIRKHNMRFEVKAIGNEDREFNLRYLDYCNKILVIKECLYNYYIRTNNGMGATLSFGSLANRFAIVNQNYEEYLLSFIERHGLQTENMMVGFYHDYINEVVKCLLYIYRGDRALNLEDATKIVTEIINYPLVVRGIESYYCRNEREDVIIPELIKKKNVEDLCKYIKEKTNLLY